MGPGEVGRRLGPQPRENNKDRNCKFDMTPCGLSADMKRGEPGLRSPRHCDRPYGTACELTKHSWHDIGWAFRFSSIHGPPIRKRVPAVLPEPMTGSTISNYSRDGELNHLSFQNHFTTSPAHLQRSCQSEPTSGHCIASVSKSPRTQSSPIRALGRSGISRMGQPRASDTSGAFASQHCWAYRNLHDCRSFVRPPSLSRFARQTCDIVLKGF